MTRILVAGGAGYIGSMLVPHLVGRGHDITVVDHLWFGNHLPQSVPVLQKDVLELTDAELHGFEQVIFLAGLSNDPMADYSPARNFVENGAAAAYLAYMAKRAGASRFIYGGSCSVYGYSVRAISDETSQANSTYPYGISKLQGEFASMQLQDSAFSVICLRQGTVSGYSPRMRLDLIVNTMFMTAVSKHTITVNNPAIRRPILAIQDAVHAYERAVDAPMVVSGVFNVASGNYTVGDVAERVKYGVERALGTEVGIVVRNIADARNYAVSIDRARLGLSFAPRHDVESIVADLAEHQESFRPFDQDRFFNIRTFTKLYPAGF